MGTTGRGVEPSSDNSGITGTPGVLDFKSGEGGKCVMEATLDISGATEGCSLMTLKIEDDLLVLWRITRESSRS